MTTNSTSNSLIFEKMSIEHYREKRAQNEEALPRYRIRCMACYQPGSMCLCSEIERIDPGIKFVILCQRKEFRKTVATGRLAHLGLVGSELISGHDFSLNRRINALIDDQSNVCLVMYPGRESINLSDLTGKELHARFSKASLQKNLVIFVIDGTWSTARQMMRSQNLKKLSQICFAPEVASEFQVRQQPAPECLSTIEAIRETIKLLGPSRGLKTGDFSEEKFLKSFRLLVKRQLLAPLKSNTSAKTIDDISCA